MKKLNKSNHGFTFLEVVISIAMVGLLCVSLSSYFSSSIKSNALSRRLQRATLANQMVLEEIRGTNYLVDIAKSYANVDPARIELSAVTGGGFIKKSLPSWDGDELENNSKYYFLRTIKIDDVSYKVLVTVDDTKYKNTVVDSGLTLPYNELMIPQINEINGDKDVVIVDAKQYFKVDGDGVTLLEQEYKKIYDNNGGSLSGMPEPNTYNYSNGMKRKLKIEVTKIDDTTAKVTAFLHFWNDNIPELSQSLNIDNTDLNLTIYDSTKLISDLSNMYVFFYPNAFETNAAMELRNGAQLKMNLYTVYQNSLTPPSAYKVNLTGSYIDIGHINYYSNVLVDVFGTSVPKKDLITKSQKKRFCEVTVQAFLGSCELDELTPENVIAEIKTTRGE